MGGVVVRDQVDVQVVHLGLDGIEEFAELHGPVPLVAATITRPVRCPGRRKRRGAVAQVIAPFHLSRAHGQQRTGAIQRLDLGLLVHARPTPDPVDLQPHNVT